MKVNTGAESALTTGTPLVKVAVTYVALSITTESAKMPPNVALAVNPEIS